MTGRDRRKKAAICGEADKKDSRPSAFFLSVDKVCTDKSDAPTEGGHDRFSAAMSETATRHGPDKASWTSRLNSRNRDAMEKSQNAEFARQRQQGYERQSEARNFGRSWAITVGRTRFAETVRGRISNPICASAGPCQTQYTPDPPGQGPRSVLCQPYQSNGGTAQLQLLQLLYNRSLRLIRSKLGLTERIAFSCLASHENRTQPMRCCAAASAATTFPQ